MLATVFPILLRSQAFWNENSGLKTLRMLSLTCKGMEAESFEAAEETMALLAKSIFPASISLGDAHQRLGLTVRAMTNYLQQLEDPLFGYEKQLARMARIVPRIMASGMQKKIQAQRQKVAKERRLDFEMPWIDACMMRLEMHKRKRAARIKKSAK